MSGPVEPAARPHTCERCGAAFGGYKRRLCYECREAAYVRWKEKCAKAEAERVAAYAAIATAWAEVCAAAVAAAEAMPSSDVRGDVWLYVQAKNYRWTRWLVEHAGATKVKRGGVELMAPAGRSYIWSVAWAMALAEALKAHGVRARVRAEL